MESLKSLVLFIKVKLSATLFVFRFLFFSANSFPSPSGPKEMETKTTSELTNKYILRGEKISRIFI